MSLAAVAVVVQTVGHLTNAFVLDYRIGNLDADADGNALSWASSVATFAAACGALLLGLIPTPPSKRLLALAGVLAFFSLDDVVAIHEKMSIALTDSLDVREAFARTLWPVLYLPLLSFVALTLWRVATWNGGRLRRMIVAALGLFVLALLGELVSVVWTSGDGTRPIADDLEVAVEEAAELGGWILVATALAAILVDLLDRGSRADVTAADSSASAQGR